MINFCCEESYREIGSGFTNFVMIVDQLSYIRTPTQHHLSGEMGT